MLRPFSDFSGLNFYYCMQKSDLFRHLQTYTNPVLVCAHSVVLLVAHRSAHNWLLKMKFRSADSHCKTDSCKNYSDLLCGHSFYKNYIIQYTLYDSCTTTNDSESKKWR